MTPTLDSPIFEETIHVSRSRVLLPLIRPQDIQWTLHDGGLHVRLQLHNPWPRLSVPDRMTIGVAAFGAFVAPRPAARVVAPPLQPGEATALDFRIPLRPEERDHGFPTFHWAGNLDVRFESAPECAVEVHRALGVEVLANGASMYMAIPDSNNKYHVSLSSMADGWRAGLGRDPRGPQAATAQEANMRGPCTILVHAPGAGSEAALQAAFMRVDGKQVPIEFSFLAVDNPRAACRGRRPGRSGIRVLPAQA